MAASGLFMQMTKAQHSPISDFLLWALGLALRGISNKGNIFSFHFCVNYFLQLLEYR